MSIKHVKQVDNVTCTSACLAMVTGKPIMDIIKEFHGKYCNRELSPPQYLDSIGVPYRLIHSTSIEPLNDGIYLMCVPSINFKGGLHNVIGIIEDNELTVLDPNEGREGKEFYVAKKDDDNELAFPLFQYIFELEFLI